MAPKLQQIHAWIRGHRWWGVAVGILAAGIFIGVLFMGPLLSMWLPSVVRDQLSAASGMDAAVGPITGNVFSGFDITHIHLRTDADDAAVLEVATGLIRLRYSPTALLSGTTAFIRKVTVSVADARVVISMDTTAGADSKPAAPLSPLAVLNDLPPLPSVALSKITLILRSASGTGSIGPADIQLKGDTGSPQLMVGMAGGQWQSDTGKIDIPPLSVSLAVKEKSLNISPAVVGDGWVTLDAEVPMDGLPETLPFTLSGRLADGAISATGVYKDHSGLKVSVMGSGVNIGKALQQSGLTLPEPLSGRLDADGQFSISPAPPFTPTGNLRATVSDGAYGTYRLSRIDASLQSDGLTLRAKRVELSSADNRLVVEAVTLPWAPLLSADIAALATAATGRIELTGTNAMDLLQQAHATEPALRDLPRHDYRLSGVLADGVLTIDAGHLAAGGGKLEVMPSTVSLPRPIDQIASTGIDLRVTANFPDLLPVSQIMALPFRVTGWLNADGAVTGSLGAPVGRASIRAGSLGVNDLAVGELDGSATATAGVIRVNDLYWQNGIDRLRLGGSVRMTDGRAEAVQASLKVKDVGPYLALATRSLPEFAGDIEATVSAEGTIHAPTMLLEAASNHLDTPAGRLNDVLFKAAATPDRRLEIDALEMDWAGTRISGTGTVTWPPAADSAEILLNAFSIDRQGIDLQLTRPARLEWAQHRPVILSPLTLSGAAGTLTVSGSMVPGGALTATASISDLDGGEWLPDLTGDRLDVTGLNGTVSVGGSLSAPQLALTASVNTLRSPLLPMPLTGRLDMAYADERLSIRQFDWTHSDGSKIHIIGDLPAMVQWRSIPATAPVRLTADIDLPQATLLNAFFGAKRISAGSLTAAVNVSGTWDNPEGTARVEGSGVILNNDGLPLPPGPLAISGQARYSGRIITIDHLDIQEPSTTVSARGFWMGLPPPWLTPLTADSAAGSTLYVDATVSASRLDWAAAGIPGVRAVDGRIGGTLQLKGDPRTPDITAALSLQNGQVRAEGRLPAVEGIQLKMELTEGHVTISQFAALLGGAPLTATGKITNALSTEPVVDITLTGDNVLLYRNPSLRVRGNTALTLTGPADRMVLTGDVILTDGLLSHHVDVLGSLKGADRPSSSGMQLFSIRQQPLNAMRLDVGLSAASPFVIRSNIVRGTVTPHLRLGGTAEVPLLKGRVLVNRAQLKLPAGRMVIENGLVQFPPADPERPVIDMLGDSKMFGYDVHMVAEGPYDEPVITLSATPPLSSEEILLMLLTGVPPSTGSATGDTHRRSLNVAVFIGQDLLSRWFDTGEGDTGESVLERFNVQLGREITQKGEETVEAQFRLADNVLMEGGTLYLTGEKDVFDYYNMGIRFVFRLR